MINSLTYYLFKIISFLFCLLPRQLSIYIGRGFGLILYYFIPLRYNVANYNLKIAFPELDNSDRKKILINTYKHYGLLIIEFLRQNIFDINNIDIDKKTKELLSINSGLILMTAHLGNWEIIIPLISQYKKSSIVTKVQRNSGGDKFVEELRNINNINLLPMGSSKQKMLDALKDNQILGLASDQNTPNGIKINFFNKKASMPKGAAYFHYKTKCPIVIGFCVLNKDYSYTFKLREISFKSSRIEDLFLEVNTSFSKIMEEEIKKYPEQYFWFHRKWDRKIYSKL